MKFTKPAIDALVCPAGRREILVFDDEVKGLGLRVTAAGAKVFLFEYWRSGRAHRMRLAPHGELTLAQARKRALALRGQVASGGDPAADLAEARRQEAEAQAARKRQAQADQLTFETLIQAWATEVLSNHRPRYAREAERALRLNFKAILSRPAALIGADEGQRALTGIQGERGAVMAARSLAYGRAMFAWATRQRRLASNPFAGLRVEVGDLSRDRVLTDVELGEVWRAAVTLGWPYGDFCRFLMLTLQREAESAGLRRSELASDLSIWTLPGERTKNRKPHIVHLVESVREILRAAPAHSAALARLVKNDRDVEALGDRRRHRARRTGADDLIFTTTGDTPLSSFSYAKRRLDELIRDERVKKAECARTEPAPLVPWRWHDLRRTGVSTMARLGVRWEVADRILNHQHGVIKGVAAVYQRYDFLAEREAAMKVWAHHVLAAAEANNPKTP